MKEGKLFKTDGTEITVYPKNGKDFKRAELSEMVEGYLEVVFLGDEMIMIMNEEGKLDELPYNKKATEIFRAALPGVNDFIVGNALYCHHSLVK